MKTEVKIIPEEDLLLLLKLYIDFGKLMSMPLSPYVSVYTLMNSLYSNKNTLTLGLYENEDLVGFITGHELNSKSYYFSGIYAKKYTKNIKLLIDKSLEIIKEYGYEAWETDWHNTSNGMELVLKKYGADLVYKRYRKEGI